MACHPLGGPSLLTAGRPAPALLRCTAWQPMLGCEPAMLAPTLPGHAHMTTRMRVCLHAGKGFGSNTKTPAPSNDASSGPKSRSKRMRQRPMAPTLPGQQQQRVDSGQTSFQAAVDLTQQAQQEAEGAEFAERLRALKAEGQERKRTIGSPAPPGSPARDSPAPAAPAAFDTQPDIYANPPTISDTLLSQLNSDVSDPKLRAAQFGPSQLGIAAGAIVLGLIFVLVSGADFAPNNRYKGVRSTQEPPDAVETGIIKTRMSALEEQLRTTPGDPEATQALALSYAQLLQYDKAADLLDKLVAKQPRSADAWRLLGETSLLAEQAKRAVAAYERAIALRNDDLQIATGMVDAYIANGQYAKAVDYLKELRTRAPEVSALGVVAKDAKQQAAETQQPADAAADAAAEAGASPAQPAAGASSSGAAAGDQQASSSSSSSKSGGAPIRPLEPVSVELLLAKTYSAWRGHDNDALATYDALIERFPEDFRGYLAKGVFLRDKGRRADAERMFLQARFYAPENRQRFVKETAETKPIVDLPEQ